MPNSKYIAGLIGPMLVVMGVSELANPYIWSDVPITQVYLAGSLWFFAGLIIIRSHNSWKGWPAAVTFVGWFSIFLGLSRMFFPSSSNQAAQYSSFAFAGQVFLLTLGIFLTYKAYLARD